MRFVGMFKYLPQFIFIHFKSLDIFLEMLFYLKVKHFMHSLAYISMCVLWKVVLT